MNSEKILNTIPKLQKLNDEELDLITSAINSCLAVKALQQVRNNPVDLEKFISVIKN